MVNCHMTCSSCLSTGGGVMSKRAVGGGGGGGGGGGVSSMQVVWLSRLEREHRFLVHIEFA